MLPKFKPENVAAAVKDIVAAASDHSGNACAFALYIRNDLASGNKDRAVKLVAELLSSGRASGEVQNIATELLQSYLRPRARGRPPMDRPRDWMNIGAAFFELRNGGKSHEDAVREAGQQFGMSETTAEEAIRYYRAFRAEAGI